MNKDTLYKIIQTSLVIFGLYWITKNSLYFFELWKSLHEQGLSNFYLFLTTLFGFPLLIPIIFAIPFTPFWSVDKKDKVFKTMLKTVGLGLLSILISGQGLQLWFILITVIHSILY
jgi:hypothetical protein